MDERWVGGKKPGRGQEFLPDMKDWDYSKTWYHGSPYRLTAIRKGSTITQERDLARVFSHKPTIVSFSEDGRLLQHSGEIPGFLYRIAEDIGSDDVYPHPRSVMAEGREWLTKREIQVALVCQTRIIEDEQLTAEQVAELKKALASRKER